MLGLIPFFPPPVFNLLGLPLDSWSLLVALGFIFGMEISRARAIRLGIQIKDIVDGALFIVGMGFIFGHWVYVLAYHPELIDEQGWEIIARIWAGQSSNGGFLGAIIGTILWFRVIRPRPFWLHADTVAYGFPFGLCLGRVGCFTAHDHVGALSEFWLAVDFPADAYNGYYGGSRHDLGLYEAIYLAGMSAVFWALRKKNLRHSSFAILFCFLYAPVRFGLDFLRSTDLSNSDVRYSGLTPAQYGSIILLCAGSVLLLRVKKEKRYSFVDPFVDAEESAPQESENDTADLLEGEEQVQSNSEESP